MTSGHGGLVRNHESSKNRVGEQRKPQKKGKRTTNPRFEGLAEKNNLNGGKDELVNENEEIKVTKVFKRYKPLDEDE